MESETTGRPEEEAAGSEIPRFRPPDGDGAEADEEAPDPEMFLVGSVGESVAYYSHLRRVVLLGRVEGQEFVEERFIDVSDPASVADHVRTFAERAAETGEPYGLSEYGHALTAAAELAADGVIGWRQAEVYVMRDIHGFGRSETAAVLGIAPNTVDATLRNARDRIHAVRQFMSKHDDLSVVEEGGGSDGESASS